MPCRFSAFAFAILALCAAPARAQILLAAPALDLRTSGTVRALARLSDGTVIVGGQFESINGLARANIARLLPDGSVDATWAPQLDGAVLALAVATDGTIIAGGGFTRVNGISLPYLARLAAGDGTPVAAWRPAPDSFVWALAVSGLQLYVGGSFSQLGGAARASIARVTTAGGGVTHTNESPRFPGRFTPMLDEVIHYFDFSPPTGVAPLDAFNKIPPSAAGYLLPLRATGDFLAYLEANPDTARAKLERYLLIGYSPSTNITAALSSLQSDPHVEFASLPQESEFHGVSLVDFGLADPVASPLDPLGTPVQYGWNTLHVADAWQFAGGHALIGVADSGVSSNHAGSLRPCLVS